MLYKIFCVIKYIIFPPSHLEIFLKNASYIEFESKLTPRPQLHDHMFYPFYYKNNFVKDCIIELKERNNSSAAYRFGSILAKWIIKTIHQLQNTQNQEDSHKNTFTFFLVPIPQHISKTKEKGFCHTTTLTKAIYSILKEKYNADTVMIAHCITKQKNIKKLHSGLNKKKRTALIKHSMSANLSEIDIQNSYFFIIDDVYTSGATFKEARRSLSDCGTPLEHIYFVSIAH